jgi:hypothetical protein
MPYGKSAKSMPVRAKTRQKAKNAGSDYSCGMSEKEAHERSEVTLRTKYNDRKQNDRGRVDNDGVERSERGDRGKISNEDPGQGDRKMNDICKIPTVRKNRGPFPEGRNPGNRHRQHYEEVFVGHGRFKRIEGPIASQEADQ